MKIPSAPEFHKPEVLEEHPHLETALKAALAATVVAGFYHHAFRNGSILNIKSKFRLPYKGWNGNYDSVDDDSPHFEFSVLVDAGKKQLLGKVFPPQEDLTRVGDEEAKIVIEENTGVTAAEIESALDSDENPLQTD